MTENLGIGVYTPFIILGTLLALAVLGRGIWWLSGFTRELIAVSKRRQQRGESLRRQLARYIPLFSFGLEDCAASQLYFNENNSQYSGDQTTAPGKDVRSPVFPEAWTVPQRPKVEVSHQNGFRIGRRAHRRDQKPRVAAMGR